MIKTHHVLALFVLLSWFNPSYGQDQAVMAIAPVDAMWGYRAPVAYQILPRPAGHLQKEREHVYVAPTNPIESKHTQPYAYGWFGTKASPHWSRQFGHQSAYTQWTLK